MGNTIPAKGYKEKQKEDALISSLNRLHYPHARAVDLQHFKKIIPHMNTGDLLLFSDPKWLDAQRHTDSGQVKSISHATHVGVVYRCNHTENRCNDRIGKEYPFPPPLHINQPQPKTVDPRFTGLGYDQADRLATILRAKAERVPSTNSTDMALLPSWEKQHEVCLLEALPGTDVDERRNSMADLVDLEARVHHFHHYMDVPERVMKNQKAEKRRCVSYRPLLLPDGGPQRVFVKVSQVVGRS
jgi:hypothetical protein